MEQGPRQTPNLATFLRLTGTAVFFPTGSAVGTHLGNVIMVGQEYGPKRESVALMLDGNVSRALEETVQVEPLWSIEGNQYHSAIRALLLMGTKNADVTQSAGTAVAVNLTAVLNGTFDLGARNITNVVVTVSAATKAADVDYYIEPGNGIIRFPEVAAGIAAGAAVVVTFDKPAITRQSFTAFNNQNPTGNLLLFQKDNKSNLALREWNFNDTLTTESAGNADPLKHMSWKMRMAVNGQPTCLDRAA